MIAVRVVCSRVRSMTRARPHTRARGWNICERITSAIGVPSPKLHRVDRSLGFTVRPRTKPSGSLRKSAGFKHPRSTLGLNRPGDFRPRTKPSGSFDPRGFRFSLAFQLFWSYYLPPPPPPRPSLTPTPSAATRARPRRGCDPPGWAPGPRISPPRLGDGPRRRAATATATTRTNPRPAIRSIRRRRRRRRPAAAVRVDRGSATRRRAPRISSRRSRSTRRRRERPRRRARSGPSTARSSRARSGSDDGRSIQKCSSVSTLTLKGDAINC